MKADDLWNQPLKILNIKVVLEVVVLELAVHRIECVMVAFKLLLKRDPFVRIQACVAVMNLAVELAEHVRHTHNVLAFARHTPVTHFEHVVLLDEPAIPVQMKPFNPFFFIPYSFDTELLQRKSSLCVLVNDSYNMLHDRVIVHVL
jgi:hypothetical protein